MIQRVLKTVFALGAGHLIQALIQFLVPAAFLRGYGLEQYGEWIVISAAVGYLSTLDFGLQTYLINELTGSYHRREIGRFLELQSTGLRVLLSLIGIGLLIFSCVLWLPAAQWLHLKTDAAVVQRALLGLAVQVLAGLVFGTLLGIYRVLGRAHQGVLWGNAQKLAMLATTLILVMLRRPLDEVAWGQCLTLLAFIPCVLWHWRQIAPELFPTLRPWNRTEARCLLKPSGCFGLIAFNQFLIYQAPVMILNQELGAQSVVAFSLARVLFSFVRQLSSMVQASISPEVTRLHGVGDSLGLARLYRICETLLLPFALVANIAVLWLSPTLLWLWVRRPEVFNLELFAGVMVISMTLIVKEYKLHFQYATNRHVGAAFATFISYLLLVAVLPVVVTRFGLPGFLVAWWLVELFQVLYLHQENVRFIGALRGLSWRPVLASLGLLGLALLSVWCGRGLLGSGELWVQAGMAVVVTSALGWLCCWCFDFTELVALCQSRLPGTPIGRLGSFFRFNR